MNVPVKFLLWTSVPELGTGFNPGEIATFELKIGQRLVDQERAVFVTPAEMQEAADAARARSEAAHTAPEDMIGLRFKVGTELGNTYYQQGELAWFSPSAAEKIIA